MPLSRLQNSKTMYALQIKSRESSFVSDYRDYFSIQKCW